MPDVGATIVRGHLQTASIKYASNQFIAQEVFPKIILPTNKAKVTIYNRGVFFRDDAIVRARGSETPTIDWSTTTENVDTKQHASATLITKEDLRDAGLKGVETPPLTMEQTAVELVAEKLDLKRERTIETLVTDGTWVDAVSGGEDAAGGWVASSGNTFLTDIDVGVATMAKAAVPVSSLRLLMDYKTGYLVKRTSDVTAALSYTGAKARSANSLLITDQMVADLLGIDKILIARGIYSTADELATKLDYTGAYIWDGANGKGFGFLYYYPPRVGLKTMAAGYTAYTKMENGKERVNYKSYDEKAHTWRYEGQEEVGGVQICANAAYLWKDTHTT